MNNIAILGGSFDPPTIGHIRIAEYVLKTVHDIDSIYIVPCYNHMFSKNMSSSLHRLKMCELACKDNGRINVLDYEISNKLSGKTYDLINFIVEKNKIPMKNISMIIGMDNANVFKKWFNYKFLLNNIRFIVVPRKGVNRDIDANWYLEKPHIILNSENNIPLISSTMIREHISMKNKLYNENAEDLIDVFLEEYMNRDVLEYIYVNNLYKGE